MTDATKAAANKTHKNIKVLEGLKDLAEENGDWDRAGELDNEIDNLRPNNHLLRLDTHNPSEDRHGNGPN